MMLGDTFAFEISLHRLAEGAVEGDPYTDAWGTWPTLAVPRESLATPLARGFDEAFAALDRLERMFAEPDGSFVWASPREGTFWQVDGNACERDGRVLLVDIKGSCPPTNFDRLLEVWGWPDASVMMHLVRPAVFLSEATFRRHAAARGDAGGGKDLRPW